MIHDFVADMKEKARADPKRIVYPEGGDDRILQAVAEIKKEGIAIPILVGEVDKIKWRAGELGVDLEGVDIISPEQSDRLQEYADAFHELRKHKGITPEQALESMKDPEYYATMMVHKDEAVGLISGASHSTADTLRPALQIIKTAPGHNIASSFFVMVFEDKSFKLFADCGFVMDPNAEELSEIAISTADSAKKFGLDPKIAMLSFSTYGSAKNPSVEKVQQATALVREKRPDLTVDGDIQLDAAIVPGVADKKCPDSPLKGDANILIFPDLNSGNIGYKLTERLAHAMALGPIVQGLNKPVNDLSRGCAVHDIIEVTAITVVEAQRK